MASTMRLTPEPAGWFPAPPVAPTWPGAPGQPTRPGSPPSPGSPGGPGSPPGPGKRSRGGSAVERLDLVGAFLQHHVPLQLHAGRQLAAVLGEVPLQDAEPTDRLRLRHRPV